MLCYQPNLAPAQWGRLKTNREALVKWGLLDVVPDRCGSHTLTVKKRVEKGVLKTSVSGGPTLTFTGNFKYKTAEGNWQPQYGVSLFTFTSKMSCASFSLPAGANQALGSCAGSDRRAVESEGSYRRWHGPIGEKYICSFCYAGKGSYAIYPSISINQQVHLNWVFKTVKAGTFVDQMVSALKFLQTPESRAKLALKGVSADYFRIHDAGDFFDLAGEGEPFNPGYYLAWCEVARRLPKIHFWAPTRVWALDKWMRVFQANPPPPNLALRPSALSFGSAAPAIPGFSNGTTSMQIPETDRRRMIAIGGVNTWNCPAYMSDSDEKSCEKVGCRVCWRRSEMPVNYRSH